MLLYKVWYDRFRGDGDETNVVSWRYSQQYEADFPLLKRFFVYGAPAMLTDSDVIYNCAECFLKLVSPLYNINPSKGLANGTTKGVSMYSLTWSKPEEWQCLHHRK